MAATSTSFRLGDAARQRLHERAEREGISATALLEQLIIEGVDTREHPGGVYRGSNLDRRAGLAGGPDVREVVRRLRELEGSEEERIAVLASETDLHPRALRAALEFVARHPGEIKDRIARNERAMVESREAAEQRQALLAWGFCSRRCSRGPRPPRCAMRSTTMRSTSAALVFTAPMT